MQVPKTVLVWGHYFTACKRPWNSAKKPTFLDNSKHPMWVSPFILIGLGSFWLSLACSCAQFLCSPPDFEALYWENLNFPVYLVSIMWESESESVTGRDYGNGVLSSSKHGLKTDGFELRGQSWYVWMRNKYLLRV